MVCTYTTLLGALKCLGIKLAIGLGFIVALVGVVVLIACLEGKK
jgi:hypothetical protein